jgi:hypothetical protein
VLHVGHRVFATITMMFANTRWLQDNPCSRCKSGIVLMLQELEDGSGQHDQTPLGLVRQHSSIAVTPSPLTSPALPRTRASTSHAPLHRFGQTTMLLPPSPYGPSMIKAPAQAQHPFEPFLPHTGLVADGCDSPPKSTRLSASSFASFGRVTTI